MRLGVLEGAADPVEAAADTEAAVVEPDIQELQIIGHVLAALYLRQEVKLEGLDGRKP